MTKTGSSYQLNKGRGRALGAFIWPASMALGVLMLLAAPASAKNEFENGFKSELGRIAAHQAVGIGLGVVGHAVAVDHHGGGRGGHGGYDGDERYEEYDEPRGHYDRHYKHKKHYKHRKHHGHHYGYQYRPYQGYHPWFRPSFGPHRGHGYGHGHGHIHTPSCHH